MKTLEKPTNDSMNALGVLVLDPKLGKLIRETDPKAFEQAVTAFNKARREESIERHGFPANTYDGQPIQNGNRCIGCSSVLLESKNETFRYWGIKECAACGGLGNTGYGDHIGTEVYRGFFAGFESEPEGTDMTYFDFTTIDKDGKVNRFHGWFWTDKAGQRWVGQTG